MLIRSRTLTGLLFITLAGTSAAGAAPLTSSTHQTEQDKARQEALAPQQQDFQSSQQRVAPQGIPFPEETHCKLIGKMLFLKMTFHLFLEILHLLVNNFKTQTKKLIF